MDMAIINLEITEETMVEWLVELLEDECVSDSDGEELIEGVKGRLPEFKDWLERHTSYDRIWDELRLAAKEFMGGVMDEFERCDACEEEQAMAKTLSVKFNDSCPACGGGNVEWASEFYEEATFNDEFRCFDCEARWVNRYKFEQCDVYEKE